MFNAFARAKATFALVAAAMALPFGAQQAALAKIAPYKSRGKGRGKPFDKQRHGNKAGKYMPHQSARECARRKEQHGTARCS